MTVDFYKRIRYDSQEVSFYSKIIMAAKKAKSLIKLESTAGTGTFLVRKKNFKTMGNIKLSFMKYDKKIQKHVLFVEKKIK